MKALQFSGPYLPGFFLKFDGSPESIIRGSHISQTQDLDAREDSRSRCGRVAPAGGMIESRLFRFMVKLPQKCLRPGP